MHGIMLVVLRACYDVLNEEIGEVTLVVKKWRTEGKQRENSGITRDREILGDSPSIRQTP